MKEIRARGLGIVGWIVADDSDEYRKRVFADPAKYASALKDFMPYPSAQVTVSVTVCPSAAVALSAVTVLPSPSAKPVTLWYTVGITAEKV